VRRTDRALSRRASGSRAFTLIEILVVISILAVLMGFGVGMIQRAGTGNLLTQTTSAAANLLATARSSAYGSASAYVTVETTLEGGGALRVYRQRPVFTWQCENFEDASEIDVLEREGNVEIIKNAAVPSLSGKHAQFDGNSRVVLENRPWQQFIDGFSLECRVNVPVDTTRQRMPLFKKGNAIEIAITGEGPGRYGVEATIRVAADEEGEGAGPYTLKTGERGPETVVEWQGPLIAGRWHDLRVSYDRNRFVIQVDGSTRGIRTGRRNAMDPDLGDEASDCQIGDGFEGGFDALQLGGIYEDDDDRFIIPGVVYRDDADGKPIAGREAIFFRNRQLDPRHHNQPIELRFRLGDEAGENAPVRRVVIGLSGETFVRRPGE
jgi:prepilin-type N-terminal cleavage/methylation domain-containing protein